MDGGYYQILDCVFVFVLISAFRGRQIWMIILEGVRRCCTKVAGRTDLRMLPLYKHHVMLALDSPVHQGSSVVESCSIWTLLAGAQDEICILQSGK
jgi:hypothetical protein